MECLLIFAPSSSSQPLQFNGTSNIHECHFIPVLRIKLLHTWENEPQSLMFYIFAFHVGIYKNNQTLWLTEEPRRGKFPFINLTLKITHAKLDLTFCKSLYSFDVQVINVPVGKTCISLDHLHGTSLL